MLVPWICGALFKEDAGCKVFVWWLVARQDASVCVNVNIFASGMSFVVAALRRTGFFCRFLCFHCLCKL